MIHENVKDLPGPYLEEPFKASGYGYDSTSAVGKANEQAHAMQY